MVTLKIFGLIECATAVEGKRWKKQRKLGCRYQEEIEEKKGMRLLESGEKYPKKNENTAFFQKKPKPYMRMKVHCSNFHPSPAKSLLEPH